MSLTVVMYHYVRDLARTRYPRIKGLTTDSFRAQLDAFSREHRFVGLEEVLSAIQTGRSLPDNALLLTFDDGYSDHYQTVFPLLHERGISGVFFPAAKPVLEGTVLDVNKVHFVLSATEDTRSLVKTIMGIVEEHQGKLQLDSPDEYWERYGKASRFDGPEIVFVKRMLQKGLPETLRAEIADRLFREHVTTDEAAFSHELYATVEQLRTMAKCGMSIGSHSYSHYWMDSLAPAEQRVEIEKSLEFLRLLGQPTENWVMCYPYGAHDEALASQLEEASCAMAFTTRSAQVNVGHDHPLRLPRIDTTEMFAGAVAR